MSRPRRPRTPSTAAATPDLIRDAFRVLPTAHIALRTGNFRCPDPRCGEDEITVLVPHPKDETHTANRCPTCLGTASDA